MPVWLRLWNGNIYKPHCNHFCYFHSGKKNTHTYTELEPGQDWRARRPAHRALWSDRRLSAFSEREREGTECVRNVAGIRDGEREDGQTHGEMSPAGAAATQTATQTLESGHQDVVHDVAMDYYGKRLATCSSDRTIKLFSVGAQEQHASSSPLATLTGHEGPVWQVAWAHPKFGSILASCSYDRKVIIWKQGADNEWTQAQVSTLQILSLFSPPTISFLHHSVKSLMRKRSQC